ncbi:phage tail collar domain protein [mine drainage metagenome]|uniref:Phage tail collar domain protein n=1 Tax=mine drainage metagenome TaxID=410659 RepID=A0A1J5RRS1_9ZZZZ
MADAVLGEIRIFPFNFAPADWAQCNGAILPVSQNPALFSLLNANYGGDGRTTFALPDLRGRTPLHWGAGQTTAAGTVYSKVGITGGAEQVSLNIANMPLHTHAVTAVAAPGNEFSGNGANYLAQAAADAEQPPVTPSMYGPAATTVAMAPATLVATGGGAHNNMQPFLVLNFCICTTGLYPSRA